MRPIQDVLHRIQWDPAYEGSSFEIGYLDRVAGAVVRVPLDAARVEAGSHAPLVVRAADGAVLRIPLHRIREVWRDGRLLWARQG